MSEGDKTTLRFDFGSVRLSVDVDPKLASRMEMAAAAYGEPLVDWLMSVEVEKEGLDKAAQCIEFLQDIGSGLMSMSDVRFAQHLFSELLCGYEGPWGDGQIDQATPPTDQSPDEFMSSVEAWIAATDAYEMSTEEAETWREVARMALRHDGAGMHRVGGPIVSEWWRR